MVWGIRDCQIRAALEVAFGLTMARVLVTGAAGFIGGAIIRRFKEARGFDNLSTCQKGSEKALEKAGYKLVKGDLNDEKALKIALEGVKTVYHEAALSSVPLSIKDPAGTRKANAAGTMSLLKACAASGVKNVVFASSSAVYGDSPKIPKTEGMEPEPKSPYAVSKLAGEEYMTIFSKAYGLNCASLRYFNVYGPGQNPKSEYAAVIPKFITAALAGKPLTIYGDGSQTRDFVYVEDVVEANLLAAGKSGIYNIASGKGITIRELAETIIELSESNSKIAYAPAREGDIKHSVADVSKAKKEIGWVPKTKIEDGLKKCIAYYST